MSQYSEPLPPNPSAWTIGQLRRAIADLPDDMPVRVTTHYDNDVGITDAGSARPELFVVEEHSYGLAFYRPIDASDAADYDPSELSIAALIS